MGKNSLYRYRTESRITILHRMYNNDGDNNHNGNRSVRRKYVLFEINMVKPNFYRV